jgi:hypothetical protein
MKTNHKDLEAEEGNIKLYIIEMRCEYLDWNHVAQDRISRGIILNMVMNYVVL